MKPHLDEMQVVEAIIAKLDADASLTSLLAVGTGTNKIRYSDQLEDEVSPAIVISAPSDTRDGIISQVHGMIIQIDVSIKAARVVLTDPADPQSHCMQVKRRVRELMIGVKGVGHSFLIVGDCASAVVTEDSDIPLRKDIQRDSEFWIATMLYRVIYIR